MERRFDLDWLRIVLFGLLVLHHVAVGFIDIGVDIYGFANDERGGPLLNLYVYFGASWRLPLLFLISGIGTWFATRLAVGLRPLARRVARLMVPALFGTFVLNATYGYTIATVTGQSPGSYLAFWASWLLEPEPIQVGHLWFLYNLALYTVLLWPAHLWWRRMQPKMPPAAVVLTLMAAGVVAIMVAFKPFFWAIAGNGYELPWYLWIFACGYVIGACHQKLLPWLARRVYWLLALALLCFAVEVVMLAVEFEASADAALALAQGGWAAQGDVSPFRPGYVLFTTVSGLSTWLWCIAFLGLAARYLNRDHAALEVLGPAVFPVYVLHFPITLIGLAWMVELPWPWLLKFWLLAALVYGLSLAIYWIVKRLGPVVYLIGGKVPDRRARFPEGPV
ncbi:MAG: acyltransferase family protein [Wenzhouxiangella sp.]